MRLIDADALKFPAATVKLDDVGLAKIDGYHMAIETVLNAPTIEAEPVVHARWEYDHMDNKCSACGTIFDDVMFWIQSDCIAPKYCPECGAKMDGGVSDAAD